MLTLFDLAAKLIPGVKASNAGCVRLLPCNLQNVAKALCSLSDYVECEMERLAGRWFSRPAVDIIRVRGWRENRAVCRRV
jgi:hypothetical protein